MSKIIFGDLLEVKSGIILHQVNKQGVMGAGIALYLAQKYPLLEKEYQDYIQEVKDVSRGNWSREIMGTVFFHNATDDIIIGNCFSQFGKGIRGNRTSYDSVIKCFENVREIFENDEVYIPFQYGSGIAGGNWNIVKEIADEYNFTIVARPVDYENWMNK